MKKKKKHKTWKACKVFTVKRLVNWLHLRRHCWARIPFFSFHTVCARPLSPTNLSWGKRYGISNWTHTQPDTTCFNISHIIHQWEPCFTLETRQLSNSPVLLRCGLGHAYRAQVGTTNIFSHYHLHCRKILSKTQAKPVCNNKYYSRSLSQHLLWNSIAFLRFFFVKLLECPVQSNNKNTVHYKHKKLQAVLISSKHFEHKYVTAEGGHIKHFK